MALSALVNTAVWVLVTLLTKPADSETLERFWHKVRPAGPGWKPVRAKLPAGVHPADSLRRGLWGVVLGIVFVYSALFGTGLFIYGRPGPAAVCVILFASSGAFLLRALGRTFRDRTDEP